MGAREKALYTRQIKAKRAMLEKILSDKGLFAADVSAEDKARNHRFVQNVKNDIRELERLRERVS